MTPSQRTTRLSSGTAAGPPARRDTRRSGEAVEGAAGTASGDVGDGSGPVDALLDPSADSGLPATDEQGAADATDDEPAPEPPADPEQVLARFRWRLDPVTLRETVDDPEELREVRERLTEKLASALDNRSRARLLSLRAVASRVLNDLDDALADGRMALTYAEATGELRRAALAQARLAHVLRWRGEFAEADRLFAEANSIELPDRLRAALHEHAARCCYDQGRLIEACHHFERALDLRGEQDAELLDRVRTGLDAVASRAEEGGFGPYPRSWDEVLERDRTPVPARDGGQGLWGYADAEGDMVVAARYAEAQPFRDGLAWVRGPQTDRWSLINLAGETVLEPTYLAARPFSDGLAWVVRDESGWHAVDATGAVAVPPGFADVRPFHKGVAVVRREGWGAVDRTGRIVVPTRYHGFHTTLADGTTSTASPRRGWPWWTWLAARVWWTGAARCDPTAGRCAAPVGRAGAGAGSALVPGDAEDDPPASRAVTSATGPRPVRRCAEGGHGTGRWVGGGAGPVGWPGGGPSSSIPCRAEARARPGRSAPGPAADAPPPAPRPRRRTPRSPRGWSVAAPAAVLRTDHEGVRQARRQQHEIAGCGGQHRVVAVERCGAGQQVEHLVLDLVPVQWRGEAGRVDELDSGEPAAGLRAGSLDGDQVAQEPVRLPLVGPTYERMDGHGCLPGVDKLRWTASYWIASRYSIARSLVNTLLV